MKNWYVIHLVMLLSFSAQAQMTVVMRDNSIKKTEQRVIASESDSDQDNDKLDIDDEGNSEIDNEFATAEHTVAARRAHAEAQARAAQARAEALRQQRIKAAQAAKESARIAALRRAYAERSSVSNTTQSAAAPVNTRQYAVNTLPPQAAPAPAPVQYQVVRPQPTLEQQWLRPDTRRTGVTLVPTISFGLGVTNQEYISTSSGFTGTSHAAKTVFAGGLMAEFGRKRFTIETGLIYMQEQIDASANSIYPLSTTAGLASGVTNDATLGFVGIPILAKVNFTPFAKTSRLSFDAGVIPAVLINNSFDYHVSSPYGTSSDVNDPNSPILNMGGWRPYNVFGTAGVGSDIGVGNNMDARIEFSYRRALMSLTQNGSTNVDTFLLSFGFGFDI